MENNALERKFDLVIFDFDGTVADTGPGVRNAIKYALNEFNIPIGDESQLDYFIGPPLYESFEKIYGATPEEGDELVNTYRVYYAEKGVFECDVYPGNMELFAALSAAGVKLAVASSKPKHFLDVVVPFIGADKYFDYIIGPELKNHNADKSVLISDAISNIGITDKSKIAMVGDRKYDMQGATSVGVVGVGVTFGYGSREELETTGAKYIAESPENLLKILL